MDSFAYWQISPIVPKSLPSTVYHYTTSAGLRGIFESGGLRATDLAHLNDSTELKFGLQVIHEVSASILSGEPSFDRLVKYRDTSAYPTMPDRIHGVFKDIEAFRSKFTFGVACFSSDGDLLSQWRGYSGNGGYAIGFDPAALDDLMDKETLPLCNVAYAPEDYGRDIRLGLTDFVNQLGQSTDGGFAALNIFSRFVIGAAVQIKHPSFREEGEIRIGDCEVTRLGKTQFRDGRNGLVPFVHINLKNPEKLPITEIVIGPGPDAELRRRTIETFLETHDYRAVKVRSSAIPFRPS